MSTASPLLLLAILARFYRVTRQITFAVTALCLPVLSVIAQAPREEMKVGAILPLSGDMALQGTAFLEGMQLAMEEANALGKVEKKIKLVVEDVRNEQVSVISTAATKLAEIDHVDAAITATYPQTMIGGKVFERNKIPVIALWDSSPAIDATGEYIFAIGPWTPASGTVPAQFARGQLKAERAAVIYSEEEWCQSVAGYFKSEFEQLRGKVVSSFALNANTSDFRAILSKIRVLKVDVIYAPIIQNLVPFYSQAYQLRIEVPIITSDNIAPEFIEKAPQAFEGVYQSMLQDPQTPIARALFERYEKRFAKKASLPWHISTGYDAMSLIVEATRRSGDCAKCVAQGLYTIDGFRGTLGAITINQEGSWPQIPKMFQVRAGKLELIK